MTTPNTTNQTSSATDLSEYKAQSLGEFFDEFRDAAQWVILPGLPDGVMENIIDRVRFRLSRRLNEIIPPKTQHELVVEIIRVCHEATKKALEGTEANQEVMEVAFVKSLDMKQLAEIGKVVPELLSGDHSLSNIRPLDPFDD